MKVTAADAISFTADTAGKYTATIEKRVAGHKAHGRCSSRAKRGKKCAFYKRAATSTGPYVAGANAFILTKKLSAGKYRATIVFTNAQNLSTTKTVNFTVKAKKKKKHKR